MPDHNSSDSIVDPVPVNESDGWGGLARFFSFATVICGGVVAFAVMTTPTRVRGATSSAKLKWQQLRNSPGIVAAPSAAPNDGIERAVNSAAPDRQ